MDLEKYNITKCTTYDLPVEYKELKIYPVKMIDYLDFHLFASCLLLDKNSVPDIEVISMTYLDYLYSLKDAPYLFFFDRLLKLVLDIPEEEQDSYISYFQKGKKSIFSINGVEYDSNDFEEIRNIICEQNCIEKIDETIQKELREEMRSAQEYRMKQNGNKMCSLEEQMVCVLISSSLKLHDIYELTIRKFSKILQRIDNKLHYQIYLSASMSGMVEIKDKSALKHWMSDFNKKDKFEDVKVSKEEIENKINLPT